MSATGNNILLVVPPFESITRPALGVSQLKAIAKSEGFPIKIIYLNFNFAERIGLGIYQWICNGTTEVMLGEYIFSHLLFERPEEDLQRYVNDVLVGTELEFQLRHMLPHKSLFEAVQQFVNEASAFCQKDAIEKIVSPEPWMVGFTSTFQQNCSSLQIIKLIKKERPDILTVMGGANCESVMGEELFEKFPDIDFIGQGECDHSFVDLIRSLRNGDDKRVIPGIISRTKLQTHSSPLLLKSEDLDRLPYPDFSDYFTQLSSVNFSDNVIPGLVMETSRGCWWGAKCQCSFCGMNGENMAYRKKSALRVVEEMGGLVKQYGIPRIFLTDNVLDMEYFKTVLPRLADCPIAELFCETKTTLSKEQARLLAASNIKWIQPGIESLSDRTLKLMRKGNTVLRSVELLKWCAELGIRATWNHLFGVPGEQDEEIPEIADIVESIHHLQPPSAVGIIDLVRFSPYFVSPEKYGLESNNPTKPYSYIYPFAIESLNRLAYFFSAEFFVNKSKSEAYQTLNKVVSNWRRTHSRSHLLTIPRNNSLLIIDTRSCSQRFWRRLAGISRKIYELCGKTRSLPEILQALGKEVEHNKVQSILQSLVKERLMIKLNGRYLSLAVDAQYSYKKFIGTFPGGEYVEKKLVKQISQYCLSMITLKISAKDIINIALRGTCHMWNVFSGRLLSKIILLFIHLLREERKC